MADSFTTEKDGQTNVARDERELLDQLLEPEVQESLTVLVKELPKLTELVKILSSSYDTVQSIATDEVLKKDTVEFMSEVAEPLKHTVKEVAQNAIEAKDHAESSSEVIGLFGLMKMLKDPQAQKMFRFVNAYLKVSAERNHKE
ncbi:DUF1641 domain-containing protein [Halobacillus litoralis]|uniref:DUF1641 domain-containing protein n=1 Tax=Halobacillus litoralis TaxID=45668 RepID=A0A845FF01_9BACI|nr:MULTISPECIES: DUF1641 domain-containing protein [Halobacillus]MEC3885571.1 DUF1641 domain-containing protein [Halobacillus sp. HZG1]MYL72441.1 DUF1641 domain-containing protein [Halobacillus litoralis]